MPLQCIDSCRRCMRIQNWSVICVVRCMDEPGAQPVSLSLKQCSIDLLSYFWKLAHLIVIFDTTSHESHVLPAFKGMNQIDYMLRADLFVAWWHVNCEHRAWKKKVRPMRFSIVSILLHEYIDLHLIWSIRSCHRK